MLCARLVKAGLLGKEYAHQFSQISAWAEVSLNLPYQQATSLRASVYLDYYAKAGAEASYKHDLLEMYHAMEEFSSSSCI